MELMKLCPEVCGDINPKNRSKKSMRSVFMWWAFDLGGGLFEEKRVYHGRRGLSRGRFWARPNKANHRSTVALFFGSLSGKSRANCSAVLPLYGHSPVILNPCDVVECGIEAIRLEARLMHLYGAILIVLCMGRVRSFDAHICAVGMADNLRAVVDVLELLVPVQPRRPTDRLPAAPRMASSKEWVELPSIRSFEGFSLNRISTVLERLLRIACMTHEIRADLCRDLELLDDALCDVGVDDVLLQVVVA